MYLIFDQKRSLKNRVVNSLTNKVTDSKCNHKCFTQVFFLK